MTYTKAQSLLINSKAKYRKTNYGKHPNDVFNIDETIKDNKTYQAIINNLDKLDSSYTNTLNELELLIQEANNTNSKLRREIKLLELIPNYNYSLIDKQTILLKITTINTLIEDCNKIINKILFNTINNNYIYLNQLIINEVGTVISAIVNKQWLSNYLLNIPRVPKIKPPNSTLICNSSGEIQWQ